MQVTWRSGGAFFSGSRPNGGVETVLSPQPLLRRISQTCNRLDLIHSMSAEAIYMASAVLSQQAQRADWSDEEVVKRVLNGETAFYALLMRRHSQRRLRVARAFL